MTTRVALRHQTCYRYERAVRLGPHEIRLRPAPLCRTPVLSYGLSVRPLDHVMRWVHDAAGNHVARVWFQEPAEFLEISVDLTADLVPFNPFDFLVEPYAERYPFAHPAAVARELAPFTPPAENGALLVRWADEIRREARADASSTAEFLVRANRRLHRDIAYVTRMEHGVQPCDDTLQQRRGSCRDVSWLLVQALRHLGLAARFVSGYLIQLASANPDAPKADQADLHAWCEAYVPGAGWIGLDPTSGLLAAEGHIPLARSSSYELAAALTGSVESSGAQLDVSMSVRRL
ncbi:MAG: transglutaminase family protein [Betaproteobacteria bacterium]|nr:transglutaminase family protein [Gammaproteobacteria bacterium]MDH3438969.1 transglutaminase family protein [Betaproteobacteria bacterium]